MNLILDSGAFTAHSQGVEIDVHEYARFCAQYVDCLEAVVNLDVIPKSSKPDDTDAAAEEGFENLQVLLAQGLNPIPVYHPGEDIDWLRYYCENYQWVGLGGMARRPAPERLRWLNRMWKLIAREYPNTRIHGFGMTSPAQMVRFPWYSVDSLSWALLTVRGLIYVPPKRGGSFDYSATPTTVTASNTVQRVPKGCVDMRNAGPSLTRVIHEFVESCGMSPTDPLDDTIARFRVNIEYFKRVAQASRVRLYFVDGGSDYGALRACGAEDRLTSYLNFRTGKKCLRTYVRTDGRSTRKREKLRR